MYYYAYIFIYLHKVQNKLNKLRISNSNMIRVTRRIQIFHHIYTEHTTHQLLQKWMI